MYSTSNGCGSDGRKSEDIPSLNSEEAQEPQSEMDGHDAATSYSSEFYIDGKSSHNFPRDKIILLVIR